MTRGKVTLMTNIIRVTKNTPFQVVAGDMSYNSILGRPWIHEMDEVPSTSHQVIKFLSKWGYGRSDENKEHLEKSI